MHPNIESKYRDTGYKGSPIFFLFAKSLDREDRTFAKETEYSTTALPIVPRNLWEGSSIDEIQESDIQDNQGIIEVNPDIMDGMPVLRGTRIPIEVIKGLVYEKYTAAKIVREVFPHLDIEDVDRLVTYFEGKEVRRRNKVLVI